MNKLFRLSAIGVCFLFLLFHGNSFAQPVEYWCIAKKDTLTDAKTYVFDIYISRQGDNPLYLNNYQLSFNIGNFSSIINSGSLTGAYYSGSSELPVLFVPTGVEIFSGTDGDYIKIKGPSVSTNGTLIQPSIKSRIGTFSVTNTEDFGKSRMNLTWRFTGKDSTFIQAIFPPFPGTAFDITDSNFHRDADLTNPILNEPVNAYQLNVTDLGKYCYGAQGVRVGLSESQTDVLYRLVKNDTAGSYVSLNSSSGNFFPGYQTKGSYISTRAYRKATYLIQDMNGTKTVTEYPEFVAGSITGDTTICYYSTPDQLTGIAPTGGNTPYSYQWQKSNDNINFDNIDGANSLNYQPGKLTDTVFYRQIQTSASGCGSATSNTVTISVYPQLIAPFITGNQTICANDQPDQLHIVSPPVGGSVVYTYKWYISENNTTWGAIADANDSTYQPAPLNTSTYYKIEISTPNCGSVLSPSIKITVNPLPVLASISGETNVCKNQYHVLYESDTVRSGYIYNWSLAQGLGSFEAGQGTNRTYIHWAKEINTTEAILYLSQTISSTQCSDKSSAQINILNLTAPDTTTIKRKTGSNMFVCADTSEGVKYQWGYNTMNPDTGIYIIGATLRYVFLDAFNSTYNYFVDTYFENPGTCTTRSYMHPYDLPIGTDDLVNKEHAPVIFPNPTGGIVNILLSDNYLKTVVRIHLYDLTGRLLFSSVNQPSRIINLNLPPGLRQGLYILKLFSATNPAFSARLKIIK